MLRGQSRVANSYFATGRFHDAMNLFQETLVARERLLGSDHPDSLPSSSSLANCYLRVGRIDEAVQMHRANLADREWVLGHNTQGRSQAAGDWLLL
ncbi:MAG TPA: tetratricopeptide repeat protein [Dehalococcoidia bacterium]|nr:tetratricopeptide repeat protein [Dehalococcoidia bacterium]